MTVLAAGLRTRPKLLLDAILQTGNRSPRAIGRPKRALETAFATSVARTALSGTPLAAVKRPADPHRSCWRRRRARNGPRQGGPGAQGRG
jgi:hypothetical protein